MGVWGGECSGYESLVGSGSVEGGRAGGIECLPSKCESLGSSLSTGAGEGRGCGGGSRDWHRRSGGFGDEWLKEKG